MAQLSPVRFRATNAIGEIVVGAGLFIFQAGTSTPADIFTDAELMTPAANPLVSDLDGYWPQFYMAAGQTLDLFARQSDDIGSTMLWQALSVDTVGQEDAASFERDFGSDGRVRIVGDSGVVRLEAGPPVGDNIGGALDISGWNDTPLDTMAIKASEIHLDGPLTLNDDAPLQLLKSTGSVAAQPSVAFTLDDSFDCWEIHLRNVRISADARLQAHLSFDGGATYKSSGGDYMFQSYGTGGSGATNETRTTSAAIRLMLAIGAAETTEGGDIVFRVVSKAGWETRVRSEYVFDGATTAQDHAIGVYFTATNLKNYGKATTIRVTPSVAANMSFDYAVYGVR